MKITKQIREQLERINELYSEDGYTLAEVLGAMTYACIQEQIGEQVNWLREEEWTSECL